MDSKYHVGQRVQLLGQVEREGIITNIRYLETTRLYTVFFSATDQKEILERDLVPPGYKPTGIVEKIYAREFLEANQFKALLTLKKIQIPLTTNIYSYLASRTKLHPLQFKPLIKFLNSNYHRILIADEVGVGKTIEAGIIYTEMKARLRDLEKVLIICPSYLLQRKWQDELYSRFDEDFELLDGQEFRDRLQNWSTQERFRGIISLPLLRRQEYLDVLTDTKPEFDLIIIDEAHHFRNDGTNTFRLGEMLSTLTNVMIFLTATPVHIRNSNLFNLLHLLIPQEYANEIVFRQTIEPNRYLHAAIGHVKAGEYKKAASSLEHIKSLEMRQNFAGNPLYEDTVSRLANCRDMPREDKVGIISNIQEMNTLGHVVTRTKKRDFPDEFPVRDPYVLRVILTPQELGFYDAVYAYAKRRSKRLSEMGYELPFLTIMLRRRAASCLPAISAYFGKILQLRRLLYEEEESEEDVQDIPTYTKRQFEDCQNLTDEDIEDIRDLVVLGRSTAGKDSKYAAFFQGIEELHRQGVKKILVFSFFRDTLNYLYDRLVESGCNAEVRLIHGDIPVEDREKIIESFKSTTQKTILLSSEVGGEGLDLQFCNCMFNYDLPWNPMIVEQRIGRLDRIGQMEKKILIYNLSVKDTIEETILERLYNRINIFRESLGDLEAILGEELDDLRSSVFNPNLTKAQIDAEIERIANSIILKQKENKKFDEEREKMLGQDTYFTEQITRIGSEKRFITGEELENLYDYYLRKYYPGSKFGKYAGSDVKWTLKPDTLLQEFLVGHMRALSPGKKERTLMAKIRGDDGVNLTFSSDYACMNKEIEFASFCHPITKALVASNAEEMKHKFVASLECRVVDVKPGNYYFVLYLVKTSGYTEIVDYYPVAVNAETRQISEKLSAMLLSLQYTTSDGDARSHDLEYLNSTALGHLEAYCEKSRAELEEKNEKLINIRISSLQRTYKVLIEQIDNMIRDIKDPKILKMKKTQKDNLIARRQKQLSELEKKKQVTIEVEEIAGGMISVLS